MENKDLFRREADGYCREDVEKYIDLIKGKYKQVYDYASKIKADNEKLKKIARALSEENKALQQKSGN